ncbi:MAG: Holliday junction branch migration protein RuvA [Gammaproteobacteria bacterium]|nr:Holliday junction branch migration protein RuvA [Gammaproteobacteria bacterium]
MIGRLRGTLIQRQAPFLLLDVNGVGYEVEATMSTFNDLPAPGAECVVYTHLIVRDDAHLLYGFAALAERALFRELIKVNGVGARMAMNVLSAMPVGEFARCIHDNDAAALTRVPGIGRKSAERLIVEMRDRLEGDAPEGAPLAAVARPPGAPADPVHDAVSALAALGYKPHEASRMVRAIDVTGKNSEEIIRSALQSAAR